MNGWAQPEETPAEFETFALNGWGDLEPERGEARPPAGDYEGVGDANPYCS